MHEIALPEAPYYGIFWLLSETSLRVHSSYGTFFMDFTHWFLSETKTKQNSKATSFKMVMTKLR